MNDRPVPYYQPALALAHHLGFGFHADRCAPGVLALLEPVLARHGLVIELGCGTGLLTKYLVDAGHRVVATDASPAMLELARAYAPGAVEVRQLILPDDPIPSADAVVGVGHALNYLPDEESFNRGLTAAAQAVRPGGILALDICDVEWGAARRDDPNLGRAEDDWAIVTEFSVPSVDRFVRQMAVFLRNDDGTWRRDDERHDNVLVDTARLPSLLAPYGIESTVAASFGDETLPIGLHTLIGRRPVEA